MNTLFVFGCSYTQNYKDNKIKNYDEYYKFKGNLFPPTWSEILSNKLNFNLKNFGVGGGGNDMIFRNFCNYINEIKKDDIVIIQWSYVHRYQWVNYKRDNWENFGAGSLGISNCITDNTHEEISHNRTHSLYVDQVYEWMKMIDKISNLVGFKVYYWSGCSRLLYSLCNEEKQNKKYLLGNLIIPSDETIFYEIFKLGGETIKKETNNLINDLHFGESSHKIMGELFYNHIVNN